MTLFDIVACGVYGLVCFAIGVSHIIRGMRERRNSPYRRLELERLEERALRFNAWPRLVSARIRQALRRRGVDRSPGLHEKV